MANSEETIATERTSEGAPPKETLFDVSLTLSPLHLLLPLVELTGEVRAADDIGLAIIGGYGSISDFDVYEIGGQFRYYATGSFDQGLELGAEVLHVGVSSPSGSVNVTGAAAGLAVGPFIGYKLTTRGGFTFDVQGGVQYMTARASAKSQGSGQSAQTDGKALIPLLNLNAGWSF